LKDGRWRCEVDCVYSAEQARDIRGMTQKCIARLERIIRRHPSAWVLNYRYFRKYPTAEELAQLEAKG
jgi:lauroyl/myristoyl acyltransferase